MVLLLPTRLGGLASWYFAWISNSVISNHMLSSCP
jgi:hypothetical protein